MCKFLGWEKRARIDLNAWRGVKKLAEFSGRALTNFMCDYVLPISEKWESRRVGNRNGKPARSRETKKNGRELADVMDLDEVYYDAGGYMRAQLSWKRRDVGKKKSSEMTF